MLQLWNLSPLSNPSAIRRHKATPAVLQLPLPLLLKADPQPPVEPTPTEKRSWLSALSDRIKQALICEDFRSIFLHDPAARHWFEVLCCYPGLHALWSHRFAHWLYIRGIPFFPRWISSLSRFFTGIEIHPGAVLGKGVFIDHGMGVVIGETAIVGDYCLIYQGVTLGGTGKETGKRHPTLGNHVVVGAGAKVLGNIEIGDRVRIGAGSIVLRDVPATCTVVGVPGRNLCRHVEEDCPLDHGKLPDVDATAIRTLIDRIERLEQELETLKSLRSLDDV